MNEQHSKMLLHLGGGGFLLVFALAPFIWMVTISLTARPDFFTVSGTVWSLRHYGEILSNPSLRFGSYFRNSMVVSLSAALSVTFLSSLAAYAVSRLRFAGRTLIPVAILAVSMFPQICIVGFLFRMFSFLGLINTAPALILPYIALTIPLALWILMGTFARIPLDIDKAACIDGASRWRTLWLIVLPIALPGIFSAFLLVFIQCFNEFLFAVMLTIDFRAQTLPVGIALFEGVHGEIPWGSLMAASVLGSVPLVVLTVVCQKFVVSGLAAGAVKG